MVDGGASEFAEFVVNVGCSIIAGAICTAVGSGFGSLIGGLPGTIIGGVVGLVGGAIAGYEMAEKDLEVVNGGGVAGALAGYTIGCYVGGLVGIVCSTVSSNLGDSDKVSSDVGMTAFGAVVAVFTFAGALLPA